MRVETQNTANGYTAQCLITGASGFSDSAPTNGASVAAARRIKYPTNILVTAGTVLTAFIEDGTGATARFWWYDSVQDLWIPNGAGTALTLAGTNLVNSIVGCMPGAEFFCQITANTAVTKVAFLIR